MLSLWLFPSIGGPGPVALCGFKLVKNFMTPLWWIIIGGISGVELTPISGMLLRSSDVKTDEN